MDVFNKIEIQNLSFSLPRQNAHDGFCECAFSIIKELEFDPLVFGGMELYVLRFLLPEYFFRVSVTH